MILLMMVVAAVAVAAANIRFKPAMSKIHGWFFVSDIDTIFVLVDFPLDTPKSTSIITYRNSSI